MKQTGITLRTFACLAKCQGLDIEDRLASDVTLSDFRNAVRLTCVEDSPSARDTIGPFLVVSYDRKVLQQTGSGHFSPIAAYDEESDSLLILDTARFKYGAHWVPLPLLFDAMLPADPETGKSRGYVLLSFHEDEEHPAMPVSLLLRTTQANHGVRQKYKEFLDARRGTPVTWEDVQSYWTQEGAKPNFIWEMTKAQLASTEEKDKEAIISVRRLILDLMDKQSSTPPGRNDCRLNASRTICMSPQEAIFVVYLASLDVETRKGIVFGAKSHVSLETKQQLLAEAELLQLAIEMSDDLSICTLE